jgi:hypothetical protein
LDTVKINRALVLSFPDLDKKNEILETVTNIVKNISHNIKNDKKFEILSNTYFEYKIQLQAIKDLVVFKQYIKEYIPKKIVAKSNKDNN